MRTLCFVLLLCSLGCGGSSSPQANAPTEPAEPAEPAEPGTPSPPKEPAVSLPDFETQWNFQDPAATRRSFQKLMMEHPEAGGPAAQPGPRAWRLELQTQIARTHGLEGDFPRGHIVLNQVDSELGSLRRDDPGALPRVHIRSLLERGRLHNSAKEVETARPLFERAWEEARKAQDDGLAVDAAHMVAIAAMGTDDELVWGRRGLELARSSSQPAAQKWRGSLLNNIGWTLHEQGDFVGAEALWREQIVERTRTGAEPALRIARWTWARGLRSLGRHQEALAELNALVGEYGEQATSDGFVSEERCENLLSLGREQEARPLCALAATQLQGTYVKDSEPARIERLAALGRGN